MSNYIDLYIIISECFAMILICKLIVMNFEDFVSLGLHSERRNSAI